MLNIKMCEIFESSDKYIDKLDLQLFHFYIMQNMQKNNMETFMLRRERYKKLQESKLIPVSTPQKFIVPCLGRTLGFRTNQYAKNSQKLEEYIDKESFQNFVTSVNKIIDEELVEKTKSQTASFFTMTSLFLKLSIGISILTFSILSCIVYIDFQPQQQKIILNISIVLIFFSVFIASICPIYLYLRKYTEYDYQAIILQKLQKLANSQNQKYKKQGRKHLQWQFEKSFFWIQLNIIKQEIQEKQRKFIYRFAEDHETPTLFQ